MRGLRTHQPNLNLTPNFYVFDADKLIKQNIIADAESGIDRYWYRRNYLKFMNEYRILIIDDNRDLADCVAILLEHTGYITTVVYTGEDAVARVLTESFELAIIDVKLPGMSGVEVFHAIRQLRPHMLGIMITAHHMDGLLREMVQQGVVSLLSKPFPMDALLARIAGLQQEQSGVLPALTA